VHEALCSIPNTTKINDRDEHLCFLHKIGRMEYKRENPRSMFQIQTTQSTSLQKAPLGGGRSGGAVLLQDTCNKTQGLSTPLLGDFKTAVPLSDPISSSTKRTVTCVPEGSNMDPGG
jgi:hypothetical protein